MSIDLMGKLSRQKEKSQLKEDAPLYKQLVFRINSRMTEHVLRKRQ
jgi:hypothetical protein